MYTQALALLLNLLRLKEKKDEMGPDPQPTVYEPYRYEKDMAWERAKRFREILLKTNGAHGWIKWADLKPDQEVEVIGYHPEWIHPDFNPNGTRVGFVGGDGEFISAKWVDHQDRYSDDTTLVPLYWQLMPASPPSLLFT